MQTNYNNLCYFIIKKSLNFSLKALKELFPHKLFLNKKNKNIDALFYFF